MGPSRCRGLNAFVPPFFSSGDSIPRRRDPQAEKSTCSLSTHRAGESRRRHVPVRGESKSLPSRPLMAPARLARLREARGVLPYRLARCVLQLQPLKPAIVCVDLRKAWNVLECCNHSERTGFSAKPLIFSQCRGRGFDSLPLHWRKLVASCLRQAFSVFGLGVGRRNAAIGGLADR